MKTLKMKLNMKIIALLTILVTIIATSMTKIKGKLQEQKGADGTTEKGGWIEKRPKKSKEVVKDDIPTNSHKEEIYENNFYNEDDYIKEENISSNSSITEKVKNTKEVQVNNKDIDMKINALFSKEEDSNRFITEKRRKKLDIEKLKDDVFLFYYYQKPVGIISKNTCIVDKIFEKDDIIRFFESQNIGLKFEDNVLQEIADIKSYVERGDVYDCN